MSILVPLLLCIGGAVLYLILPTAPLSTKVAEIGRLAFLIGFFFTLQAVGPRIVSIMGATSRPLDTFVAERSDLSWHSRRDRSDCSAVALPADGDRVAW